MKKALTVIAVVAMAGIAFITGYEFCKVQYRDKVESAVYELTVATNTVIYYNDILNAMLGGLGL